jgi:hypothetical protein
VIAWLLWSLQPGEWIAAGLILLVAVLVFAVTSPSRRTRAVRA